MRVVAVLTGSGFANIDYQIWGSFAVVVVPSAVEIFASGAQWPNFSQALRRKTPSLLAYVAPR